MQKSLTAKATHLQENTALAVPPLWSQEQHLQWSLSNALAVLMRWGPKKQQSYSLFIRVVLWTTSCICLNNLLIQTIFESFFSITAESSHELGAKVY